MIDIGNIFDGIPASLPEELTQSLVKHSNVTIERIVSRQHASPEDFWYNNDRNEWVLVLQGNAGLLFEGEEEARVLKPGDYLLIPAHLRHRVVWTDPYQDTIWLAAFY